MSIEGNDIGQAVIMAVDVADYDRLVAADEAGTRARLKSHRIAASALRRRYGGEIVGAEGDSVLMIFDHAVPAVQYARDVQHLMFARNAELRRGQRMLYRIGIHQLERGVLESAGAEVATALMAAADGGGICLSGPVLDAARLKIHEPVNPIALPASSTGMTGRAFNMALTYQEIPADTAEDFRAELRAKAPRYALLAATVMLAVAAGIFAMVQKPWRIKIEPASLARMALALPERPSLVVLPFENGTSGGNGDGSGNVDGGAQWLADGFTEQITSALARNPALFVIARNSAASSAGGSAAGGRAATPAAIAEALGVRYILRGSARQRDGNLRLEVVLIDALEGYYMWSASYDRPLTEFFAVRDEVGRKIAGELDLASASEDAGTPARRGGDMRAFALFTQGQSLFRHFNRVDNAAARVLFERASEVDPGDGASLVYLGWTHLLDAGLGWNGAREASLGTAEAVAARALKLVPGDAEAQGLQSMLRVARRNIGEAVEAAIKAVELTPNSAERFALLGQQYRRADEYGKCAAAMRTAMRLNPYYPDRYLSLLGDCAGMSGHYREALPAFEEYQRRLVQRKSPTAWRGMMKLAWLHQQMGEENEAFRYYLASKAMKPDISEQAHLARQPWTSRPADTLALALHLVGAPES